MSKIDMMATKEQKKWKKNKKKITLQIESLS